MERYICVCWYGLQERRLMTNPDVHGDAEDTRTCVCMPMQEMGRRPWPAIAKCATRYGRAQVSGCLSDRVVAHAWGAWGAWEQAVESAPLLPGEY